MTHKYNLMWSLNSLSFLILIAFKYIIFSKNSKCIVNWKLLNNNMLFLIVNYCSINRENNL